MIKLKKNEKINSGGYTGSYIHFKEVGKLPTISHRLKQAKNPPKTVASNDGAWHGIGGLAPKWVAQPST